jgi:hypothetical protein
MIRGNPMGRRTRQPLSSQIKEMVRNFIEVGKQGKKLTKLDSSVTHHLPVAARRRFESSGAADLHLGATEHVGEDYKVRIEPALKPGNFGTTSIDCS